MQIRQSQLDAFAEQWADGRKLVHAYSWANDQPGARVDEATATAYIPYSQDKIEQARFGPHGLLELRTPEGRQYRFDYDQEGRVTQAALAGQPPYRLSYGKDGQLAELRRGDRPMLRLDPIDESGESVEATFADGSKERLIYEQGLLLGAEDAAGGRLELQRDDQQRVEAVVDARGNAVRYERDDDDPLGVTVVNANGRREQWQSDGESLSVSVDGQLQGRVTGTEDAQRAEYADGHAIEISWDGDRPLKGVTTEIEVSFTYDAEGRVKEEKQGAIEIAYDYDDLGNLESLTTSDGQKAHFSYDADGMLVSAEETKGAAFRFEYTNDGVVSRLTCPNGVETLGEYQQTANGAESRIRIRAPGFKAPVTLERTLFDARGRAVRQRLFDAETVFAYDPAGRLTEANNVAQGAAQQFGWDAAGNRVSISGKTAAFDASNQILYQGEEHFRHDALGQMTARSGGPGSVSYRYNGQGHLIEARTAIGKILNFAYDAFGRRIRKTCGERVTHFLWAGQQLLREWTLEGDREVERRDYLFMPGEFHPLAVRINGQLYCYHLDRAGTPIALTDARGALAWRAGYDAFGGAVHQEGRIRQPLRHLGQYCDDETGLHYNLFRYYDPSLGRYLSPDPLRFRSGSTNFYSYANGDPINQRDPTGHLVFLTAVAVVGGAALVGGVIGGAIGAATAKEGERGSAFAKGFGWGALGGAVGAAVPLIGAAAGLGAAAIAGAALAADAVVSGIEACAEGSGIGGVLKSAGTSVGITLATLGLGKIPGVKRALGTVGKRLSRTSKKLTGRAKQLWYKLFPSRLKLNRGFRKAAKLQRKAFGAAANDLANKAGMSKAAARHVLKTAKKHDVTIQFRPSGKESVPLRQAGHPPKGLEIKNKSINADDIKYLGAPDSPSQVGHFNPQDPTLHPDWPSLTNKEKRSIAKRWSLRKKEFRNPNLEPVPGKSKHFVMNGKEVVLEDGLVKSPKKMKSFVSDSDLFDIKNADGTPISIEKRQAVRNSLQAGPVDVMHNEVMDPEWHGGETKENLIKGHTFGEADSVPVVEIDPDNKIHSVWPRSAN